MPPPLAPTTSALDHAFQYLRSTASQRLVFQSAANSMTLYGSINADGLVNRPLVLRSQNVTKLDCDVTSLMRHFLRVF